MRLKRIQRAGSSQITPVVEYNGKHYLVSGLGVGDFTPGWLAGGGLDALGQWLKTNPSGAETDITGATILAPMTCPEDFLCIGLNYEQHALESGKPVPKQPVNFSKHRGSYSDPFGEIVLPKAYPDTVDWEVELAVIIGEVAHNVSAADALSYVAGYTVVNDVSHRHWQLHQDAGGQWNGGKGCPSFTPFGPSLVTPDEIVDPQNLRLWCNVNGQTFQNSNTSDMVFPVNEIIEFLSRLYRLLPGDMILTGTPQGVGMGQKPPIYLKPGDVVTCGVQHIGKITQTVVAAV